MSGMMLILIAMVGLSVPVRPQMTVKLKLMRLWPGHGGTPGHRGLSCNETTAKELCGYRLNLCLDSLTHHDKDDLFACNIAHYQTRPLRKHRVYWFHSNIGGVANPIIVKNDTWPEVVGFKLFLSSSKHPLPGETISNHVTTLDLAGPSPNGTSHWKANSVTGYHNGGFTRLDYRYMVQCAPNMYDVGCDVFCQETDDVTGHYMCDKYNGRKICLSGWSDPSNNCTVPESSSSHENSVHHHLKTTEHKSSILLIHHHKDEGKLEQQNSVKSTSHLFEFKPPIFTEADKRTSAIAVGIAGLVLTIAVFSVLIILDKMAARKRKLKMYVA